MLCSKIEHRWYVTYTYIRVWSCGAVSQSVGQSICMEWFVVLSAVVYVYVISERAKRARHSLGVLNANLLYIYL